MSDINAPSTWSRTECEPMLVTGMRRWPIGDVRHTPENAGAGGTSTRGFLHEYDDAIDAAERRGAVKALRAVADEGRRMPLYELRDRADAIENGADW